MNFNQQEGIERYYTFDEYLALEEVAEVKHEYHGGKVIAMAGGTGNHSILSGNIVTELNIALRKSKKKCTTFNSDMKVKINKFNKGVYPDASVVCGKPIYTNNNKTVLENPMLIIEVLSASTKSYDKADKFLFYRSIPSFKEYMIIYQSIPRIETWYKEEENLWRIGSAVGLDKSIYLHSIDATLLLSDIYAKAEDLILDENVALDEVF